MALRSLTIDDINELEHGNPIPCFQGRITKVFDQKTGEGQYGPWHLQTMMVGEGESEIAVTWTGEDDFRPLEWEGQLVSFECSENNKGKLVGVLRDIRVDKEGKTWKGVKVNTAAKIKRLENQEAVNHAVKKLSANVDSLVQQQKVDAEKSQNSENPKPIPAKPNGDKITSYAQHAGRIFAAAWEESKTTMVLVPQKDGEEMTPYEWNDLRLRIAQGFAIEINKIIRKERF